MRRVSRRRFLGGFENSVCDWPLEITKGRAVNGVDDYRNASAFGGEAAENAGFAAVGVNDVWFATPKNFGELTRVR